MKRSGNSCFRTTKTRNNFFETSRCEAGVFILDNNKITMDNKTKKVPTNTITRDTKNLAAPTGNIYETVVVLYKRANQIALAEKKELNKKLEDFRNERDTMDEVFENKEQIEISKYYEKQPKPDLVAISEFENGDLFYRKAGEEDA